MIRAGTARIVDADFGRYSGRARMDRAERERMKRFPTVTIALAEIPRSAGYSSRPREFYSLGLSYEYGVPPFPPENIENLKTAAAEFSVVSQKRMGDPDDYSGAINLLVTMTKVIVRAWSDSIDDTTKRFAMMDLT
jgi:hypothetical protein